MLDKLPIHSNSGGVSKGKGTVSANNIFTEVSSNNGLFSDLIPFREWLDSKGSWLQFGMRDTPWKCGSRTRIIDSTIKSCPDQTIIYNNDKKY